MSYGNYVYTADDGTDYAVSVPIDFATALGMVPATTQPYIDTVISPRYATFRNTLGQFRSALIDSLLNFASTLGRTLTVSSLVWTCVTAHAETYPPIQPLTVDSLVGPPGPPGPIGPPGPPGPGGGGPYYKAFTASDIYTGEHSASLFFGPDVTDPGTYIIRAEGTLNAVGGPGWHVRLRLENFFDGSKYATNQTQVPDGGWMSFFLEDIIVVTGRLQTALELYSISSAGALKHVTEDGENAFSGIILVKIA